MFLNKLKSLFVLDWDKIRIIGHSKLVQLTMLVPIIGYMIIFNSELTQFFELSVELLPNNNESELESNISEDNKSRLFYFYYGFSFIGLASLFYKLFCPTQVDECGNITNFVESELKLLTEGTLKKFINYLSLTIKNYTAQEIVERYKEHRLGVNYPREEQLNHLKIDTLKCYWRLMLKSKPAMRVCTTLFYFVGFSILLIPTLEIFIRVSIELFKF